MTSRPRARPAPSTHLPVIGVGEAASTWQALLAFLPAAAAYAWRHLTVGTWVRLRRAWLRRRSRVWYL
jgi:hypothetical protein